MTVIDKSVSRAYANIHVNIIMFTKRVHDPNKILILKIDFR